jgi:fatty acid desaturase
MMLNWRNGLKEVWNTFIICFSILALGGTSIAFIIGAELYPLQTLIAVALTILIGSFIYGAIVG